MSKSKEQELAIKIAGKIENSFKSSVSQGQSELEKLGSAAKKAAAVAAAAFAAVKIGDFISDAVDEYSEFEQSMANTSAIAGASASDYELLEQAARDAGKATTFTASEAADALGYMALAGWEVTDSTTALTPILQLAEATQADLATTSDQVTDSMSALGLGIDELSDYLNVVVATNNNANTTASDLMDAFIGCGGAAKSAGMDYQDTATALGILANNGIKGSEAGTALNSMLVRMTTKDKAISAMEELGVAVYDSSGNMRDMQDILVELNGAMDGMSDSQKNAYMSAIAGTNYYTQFGYLLEGVKEGADGSASAWDSLTESLKNSDGALEDMDASVTDTLSGAISRMQSALSDFKISMIEDFGGPAAEVIDTIATKIPEATATFKQMIDNAVQVVSDHAPDIEAVKNLLSDIGDRFAEAFGLGDDSATDLIENGIPDLLGKLLEVAGNVAEVADKFVEWDGFIPTVTTLATAIAGFKLVKTATEIASVTKALTLLNIAKVKDKAETIYLNALYAKDAIVKAGSTAATVAQTVATGAWNVVCGIATAATTALGAAFTFLTSPIGLVVLAIAAVIAIGVLLYKNWDTVKAKAAALATAVGEKFSAIKDGIKTKMTAAKEAVTSVLGNIKKTFTDKLQAAHDKVKSIVDKIKGVFNFSWSLPKLKIPHISVTGGEAPYGIAGKGSLPKFSIEWYKEGGIMKQPTAFGINPTSGDIMAGGEAGAEAIVPLSELWENMRSVMKGIISDMTSGSNLTPIGNLLGSVSGESGSGQLATAGGPQINYAPVYNFSGGAPTTNDLVEAERISQDEFNQLMTQWQRDNDRKKF